MADRDLDPAEAMALLEGQERRVRRALDPGVGFSYLVWGTAWVIGFGAIWWQALGQNPYAGPGPLVAGLFAVLLTAAAVLSGWRIQRASAGIGGESARRGRLHGLGWSVGLLALFAILAALGRVGAPAPVLGVLGVCGPLLVVGLMYIFGAACFGSRSSAALGVWLLVLAAVVGFTGPVVAPGLAALLGGGGFFVAAVLAWRGLR